MKNLTSLFLATLILKLNVAFAHGENKPGPHGGIIRMPGTFHTEVVPLGKTTIKIFLLDMEWKNPSINNSEIQVILNNKSKERAQCRTSDNYYLCSFSKSVDLTKKGELKILAQREGQKGAEVSYFLPLKFEVIDGGHEGHH